MDYQGVLSFLKTASMYDLLDISEAVRSRIEDKKNEERTVLLQVRDESMVYGHFPDDDYKAALEYALKQSTMLCGRVTIEPVRVRTSEVEETLRNNW